MIKLGIDVLLEEQQNLISGQRVGILAHAASLSCGVHTVDRIARSEVCSVNALFGPEHGIQMLAQDMEGVAHSRDLKRNIPIYSLYGTTLDSLKPSKEQLQDIDVLVVDLQDIGSRYYTYVWTTCLCMEAIAEIGKKIIICDRPNPIGGTHVEGGGIELGYESFVGLYSIPVRHGMTLGEIAGLVNSGQGVGASLDIVEMEGWRREMSWPKTKLPWVNPSPNMRSYTAALLYPGMCLLEGTNISEGRGTDTPFEIVGAPYINSDELIEEFEKLNLPGVKATPTSFIPVMQKWHGRYCNGIRWIITDAEKFCPYLTGLVFVWLIYNFYKDRGFEWRTEPYEFVTNRPAVELLTGSHDFLRCIAGKCSAKDIERISKTPEALLDKRSEHLFY